MRRPLLLLAAAAVLGVLFLLLRGVGVPDDSAPRTGPESPDTTAGAVEGTAEAPVLRGTEPRAESEPVPAAAPAPAPESDTIATRLRGRVVDERRRGVGGVRVAVVVDGDAVLETRTAEDGSYRLEGAVPVHSSTAWMSVSGPPRCECLISATAEDGRAGRLAQLLLAQVPEDEDRVIEPIVLGEAFPLVVLVRGDGKPVPGARVRVGCGPADSRKRWHWQTTAVTDASGVARVVGLPRGTAGVYANADGWGPAVAGTAIPVAGGSPLEVDLPPERHAEILVQEEGTEQPVEGAEVFLGVRTPKPDRGFLVLGPSAGIVSTGADGTTRVPVFAAGTRGLAYVHASGRPRRTRASYAEMDWDAAQTVVTVPAPNTLVWTVVEGDGPVPEDGTPVRMCRGERMVYGDGFLPPEAGRIDDGRLVVPNAVAQTDRGAYRLIAVLPDGRWARADVPRGEAQGTEVAFREPRTLRVQVRDHEGKPSRGVAVFVRSGASSLLRLGLQLTDRDGSCVLTPLLQEVVEVDIHGFDAWIQGQSRTVDLRAGDGTLTFDLPAPQRLRIQVLVDGKPRLPPAWNAGAGSFRLEPRYAEEDAETGTIRATLYADERLVGSTVGLTSEAFGTASGTAQEDPATGEAVVTLSLHSPGRILAHVVPPGDGMFELWLERYGPQARVFSNCAMPQTPEAARDGVFVFEALEPGRYRLLERNTHLASKEVEAGPSHGDVRLDFDLSGVGWVSGRVEAPDPSEVAGAYVVVRGLDVEAGPPIPGVTMVGPGGADVRAPAGSTPVGPTGTFAVRVPGDRTLTLDVWHPLLASGGTVSVREPCKDVRLVLVHGPTATLVLDRDPTPAEAAALAKDVLLFRGDLRGKPAWRCAANVAGREIRFGRYEPGTYTLWLDPGALAPILLRDVVLGEDPARIDGVPLSKGCRLRVDLRLPTGTARPSLGLSASALDGPVYARSRWFSTPDDELELSGLGPGRFRVRVDIRDERWKAHESVFEREVELDGVTDERIEVDAR